LQNSVIGEYFIELFEIQWREIYKVEYKGVERRNFIFMLLPIADDTNLGIDLYMRYPAGEFEITKREISIFLIFRKLRYYLIKESKFSKNLIENYQHKSDKPNLSNTWEEGKLYEIDQRKLLPCYIKKVGNKQQCYIAEDEENLILIAPDHSKLHWARIVYNIKLKTVEATIDRSDPRSLNIVMKSADNKDKYETLSFDDHTLCLAAKRTLDENRRSSKTYEMSMIKRNFENAINDIIDISS